MKRFRRSVCAGKFLPPHRGHKLLIDTAQEQSEQVVVITCEKPRTPFRGNCGPRGCGRFIRVWK